MPASSDTQDGVGVLFSMSHLFRLKIPITLYLFGESDRFFCKRRAPVATADVSATKNRSWSRFIGDKGMVFPNNSFDFSKALIKAPSFSVQGISFEFVAAALCNRCKVSELFHVKPAQ